MRLLIVASLMALLAACSAPQQPNAPAEVIAAKAFRAPGPASLTVMTMVNNRTGSGGHTAMMINGSQRVIFDPAGSFAHEIVPERDDVLYGVTPAVLRGYKSAHARATFRVVSQTFTVTPEQAEIALQLVQAHGPVPSAQCAASTTRLLRQVPGFENTRQTMFPTALMDHLAQRPGVVTEVYREDDDGGIRDGVANVVISD